MKGFVSFLADWNCSLASPSFWLVDGHTASPFQWHMNRSSCSTTLLWIIIKAGLWTLDWTCELDYGLGLWTGLWTGLVNWTMDWTCELDYELDLWTGLWFGLRLGLRYARCCQSQFLKLSFKSPMIRPWSMHRRPCNKICMQQQSRVLTTSSALIVNEASCSGSLTVFLGQKCIGYEFLQCDKLRYTVSINKRDAVRN